MTDIFSTPAMQSVFSFLILGVLIASGVWLMSRFRGRIDEDRESSFELLSNFEEMVRDGDISESEFRTIEAVMGENPISDTEDSGQCEAS